MAAMRILANFDWASQILITILDNTACIPGVVIDTFQIILSNFLINIQEFVRCISHIERTVKNDT